MKTIVISRKRWLRGKNDEYDGNSLWCSDRQAGCCLGHVIHQTGKHPWSILDGVGTPDEFHINCGGTRSTILTSVTTDEWGDVAIDNNELASEAMKINDNDEITDRVRENRLIKLFKKHKIKLVFKD